MLSLLAIPLAPCTAHITHVHVRDADPRVCKTVKPQALFMQVVQAGGGNHSLTHVVDIYRGANNASIRRNNHNQLDVHGLGKEYRHVHHT